MRTRVDLDDLVFHFVQPLVQFHHKRGGPLFSFESIFSYRFDKVMGISKQEVIRLITDFYLSSHFDDLPLVDGALEGVEFLRRECNGDLGFLTSRYGLGKEKTPIQLIRYFGEDHPPVSFAGHYNEPKISKAEICVSEGVEVMFEDHGDWGLECAKRGVRTILFDKPWNKGIEHPNLVRVSGWEEGIEIYQRLKASRGI